MRVVRGGGGSRVELIDVGAAAATTGALAGATVRVVEVDWAEAETAATPVRITAEAKARTIFIKTCL